MKYDRSILVAFGAALLSLAVAIVAIVLVLRAEKGPGAAEMAELRDRIDVLEGELDALRDRESDGSAPVKEVFSAAAMEGQMKKLRAEVDALKNGGGGQSAVIALQERQERILKDANKAYFKAWKETLDTNLAQNGFDEDQRRRIGGDYAKLLEELEEAQIRWSRGDIDWNRAMDEVKMRSIEFYDSVERGADTDTARRVIDIAFPTPEMKKLFFSGSGQ